jgi:hypothetical protein
MNDDPQIPRQGAVTAAEVLARDKRHVWHPYTQHGTESEPIVIARAKGASLFDAEGKEITGKKVKTKKKMAEAKAKLPVGWMRRCQCSTVPCPITCLRDTHCRRRFGPALRRRKRTSGLRRYGCGLKDVLHQVSSSSLATKRSMSSADMTAAMGFTQV